VNAVIDAFFASDFLGKLIFIGLFALSCISWTLLIYKIWEGRLAEKGSLAFAKRFELSRQNPLALDLKGEEAHPFFSLYSTLKKHALEILNKNRHYGVQKEGAVAYLSVNDMALLDTYLAQAIAKETKFLEKNLYVLSIIVSLAPFLGLLGTVWGILLTFSELQVKSGSSAVMLGGLSLALATTVVGLLDAIPALIGYHYLKNKVREFQSDMENFSLEILAAVEFQYRKVDE
jgi:biopolymer transport protein TolQ